MWLVLLLSEGKTILKPRFTSFLARSKKRVGHKWGLEETRPHSLPAFSVVASEKKPGKAYIVLNNHKCYVYSLDCLVLTKVFPISFGIALWLLVINPVFLSAVHVSRDRCRHCHAEARRWLTSHFISLSSWSLHYAQTYLMTQPCALFFFQKINLNPSSNFTSLSSRSFNTTSVLPLKKQRRKIRFVVVAR